jgi:hypothetical protein
VGARNRTSRRLTRTIRRRTFTASRPALAQHQSHVALLDSWGVAGLAAKDLEGQRQARPTLNAAAEHDATTRVVLEGIIADEEQHLAWLETELDLLERLGEPLHLASRLGVGRWPS